jgi:hypothetical protein
MSSSRSQQLSLSALALSLGAGAWLMHYWLLVIAAFAVGLSQTISALSPEEDMPTGKYVLRLFGMNWTLDEALTHWVIVMRSGHGKTAGIVRTMISQLMRSVPEFGAIAIDEKANFHKVLQKICTAFGRRDKLIVLRPRRPGTDKAMPIPWRMNFIGDRSIPWETYAQIVIDVAVACGQETNNPFFKGQGRKTIALIFQTLEAIGLIPTLGDAYDFIADDATYKTSLEKLQLKGAASELCEELLGFWQTFEMKGPDEKSGIKSTTELYLYPYSTDELRDVFGDPNPTVHLNIIDQGKILCPSVPQAFLTQRRYITAWFKLAGYYHLLRRFDEFDFDTRHQLTPIFLFADEGQNSILAGEEGLADHNSLDKIREARGTLVLSMQSYSSAMPPLKGRKELAEAIFTNLNNHIIGKIQDESGREMAANHFGKTWQKDQSHSFGNNSKSTSVKKELRHVLHSGEFNQLAQFQCYISHVNGQWRKGFLPPRTDDGRHIVPLLRLKYLWKNLFA